MHYAKLRAEVDRYSFLVGLFHSLLHAGLSRRTNIPFTLKIPQFGYQSVSNTWSLASPVRKVELKLIQVQVKEWGSYFCADGAARIRRTEVRPILRRRAISDLLIPARRSLRT